MSYEKDFNIFLMKLGYRVLETDWKLECLIPEDDDWSGMLGVTKRKKFKQIFEAHRLTEAQMQSGFGVWPGRRKPAHDFIKARWGGCDSRFDENQEELYLYNLGILTEESPLENTKTDLYQFTKYRADLSYYYKLKSYEGEVSGEFSLEAKLIFSYLDVWDDFDGSRLANLKIYNAKQTYGTKEALSSSFENSSEEYLNKLSSFAKERLEVNLLLE